MNTPFLAATPQSVNRGSFFPDGGTSNRSSILPRAPFKMSLLANQSMVVIAENEKEEEVPSYPEEAFYKSATRLLAKISDQKIT